MKTNRKIEVFLLILMAVYSVVKNISPTPYQFSIVCLGWAMSKFYIGMIELEK